MGYHVHPYLFWLVRRRKRGGEGGRKERRKRERNQDNGKYYEGNILKTGDLAEFLAFRHLKF